MHTPVLNTGSYKKLVKSRMVFVSVDLSRQLPDWSTYCASWIETRPGEPNPKTGIPPSLCTLSVADFIRERGMCWAVVFYEKLC